VAFLEDVEQSKLRLNQCRVARQLGGSQPKGNRKKGVNGSITGSANSEVTSNVYILVSRKFKLRKVK
jgi:hypothetical protein